MIQHHTNGAWYGHLWHLRLEGIGEADSFRAVVVKQPNHSVCRQMRERVEIPVECLIFLAFWYGIDNVSILL